MQKKYENYFYFIAQWILQRILLTCLIERGRYILMLELVQSDIGKEDRLMKGVMMSIWVFAIKFQKTNVYQFKDALPRAFYAEFSKIIPELNNQLKLLQKRAITAKLVLLDSMA